MACKTESSRLPATRAAKHADTTDPWPYGYTQIKNPYRCSVGRGFLGECIYRSGTRCLPMVPALGGAVAGAGG